MSRNETPVIRSVERARARITRPIDRSDMETWPLYQAFGNMTVTDEIIADLKSDEGFVPFAYDDKTGQPVECSGWVTAGYGFVIDARKKIGIPRPVAEFWLRYALNERLDSFRKYWPAYDKQPTQVQRALGSMVYQLGPDGVLNFPRMLTALAQGDRETAAMHALDSLWAKEQSPNRARRIANMLRGHP